MNQAILAVPVFGLFPALVRLFSCDSNFVTCLFRGLLRSFDHVIGEFSRLTLGVLFPLW